MRIALVDATETMNFSSEQNSVRGKCNFSIFDYWMTLIIMQSLFATDGHAYDNYLGLTLFITPSFIYLYLEDTKLYDDGDDDDDNNTNDNSLFTIKFITTHWHSRPRALTVRHDLHVSTNISCLSPMAHVFIRDRTPDNNAILPGIYRKIPPEIS